MPEEHIVQEDCDDCGGEGSWDSSSFPNYYTCDSCNGQGHHDVVLTEFSVTETYTIKAKTLEEAEDMVMSNEFKYGVDNQDHKIKPNF